MATKLSVVGTKKEKDVFSEVHAHYLLAKEDLDQRLTDWDKKDELFRSHINSDKTPYNAEVFDPRVFTAIFEKTARLLGNKPRGRMVPREGGDSLGAHINNQLLQFQWDDAERVSETPLLGHWATMDMNARKYGASFALVKWHYKRRKVKNGKDKEENQMYKSVPEYDGPSFRPLINRDCLPNPSYSSVKNWFQHRDYVTIQELETVNDAARTKPTYKNLDLLKMQIKRDSKGGGDRRDTNWTSKNKTIKGLSDYLGSDETFKVVEVVTEYRNDRWITFAPRYGVVIRDIDNPYDHGRIPIVMLKYYPIDDDLYGLSEIEPVERLQRGINALINQYLDAINMSLYAPLKIRANAVQMHTLEFGPGAKWIMNDPINDVIPHDQAPTGVNEFTSTYSFMVSALQNALGETSQGVSNISPFESDKTATEVRDSAAQRNARDNFNQIFLAEALKKQMMFWHVMNRQFLFDNPKEQQKIIRIVGKEAIRYFERRGLADFTVSEDAMDLLSAPENEDLDLNASEFATPEYPVMRGGDVLPKFTVEPGGEVGHLIIEPEDLSGNYDYIPDIESMQLPDEGKMLAAKKQAIDMALLPQTAQLLASEGYSLKFKELFEDYLEHLGQKDAEKYFEKGGQNGAQQAGPAGIGAGALGGGLIEGQGMVGGAGTMAQGQAGPVVPGSVAL